MQLGQLGASWDAIWYAHVGQDADMACVLLMESWLEELAVRYYSSDPDLLMWMGCNGVLAPCLRVHVATSYGPTWTALCKDRRRRAHRLARGLFGQDPWSSDLANPMHWDPFALSPFQLPPTT